MERYDQILFDPPAPLARVTLRNPVTGQVKSDVPMLIDSGADVTLIPASSARELELDPSPSLEYDVTGFDGRASSTSAVSLELVFCHRTFRGQFLLLEQPWGILGRNVLNRVKLTLDGPRLRWYEDKG